MDRAHGSRKGKCRERGEILNCAKDDNARRREKVDRGGRKRRPLLS